MIISSYEGEVFSVFLPFRVSRRKCNFNLKIKNFWLRLTDIYVRHNSVKVFVSAKYDRFEIEHAPDLEKKRPRTLCGLETDPLNPSVESFEHRDRSIFLELILQKKNEKNIPGDLLDNQLKRVSQIYREKPVKIRPFVFVNCRTIQKIEEIWIQNRYLLNCLPEMATGNRLHFRQRK